MPVLSNATYIRSVATLILSCYIYVRYKENRAVADLIVLRVAGNTQEAPGLPKVFSLFLTSLQCIYCNVNVVPPQVVSNKGIGRFRVGRRGEEGRKYTRPNRRMSAWTRWQEQDEGKREVASPPPLSCSDARDP